MSLMPILWALKSAPVADAEERAILVALAEKAWSDGTDALPSKKTIAKVAVIDPKTVQRRLRTLTERGLIAKGNQEAAAYLPEYCRPTVYDLMIPYSWFRDIDEINGERQRRGLPPLTPENRPDLGAAPPKKHRADKGKPRKKSAAPPPEQGGDSQGGGDYKSPGSNPTDTGQEGGTTSPGGGDYKSTTQGLEDPQPSPAYPPQDPPRPSFPAGSAEGGTDGSAAQPRNLGVDLLIAIGAEKPEFLLTGKTLTDQGLMVTAMLLEGWTEGHLRQVIAGRPLPDKVTASVGAIVAKRLRDAVAGPAPSSVPKLPEQFSGQPGAKAADETWTPDDWTQQQARDGLWLNVECNGRGGMCGRPMAPGESLCVRCSDELAAADMAQT